MDEIKIDENHQEDFVDILKMIKASRERALKSVNRELINLYWNIGKYIDEKIDKSRWGNFVVEKLSDYLSEHEPRLKSFPDQIFGE
ncbi:MAG: DUF1016 N-terminal domain-containing protein [Methanobrevibacter sp.]|nr:DUF1016 N-terminal domain-containing protein [Methanobrevibacter sp.]